MIMVSGFEFYLENEKFNQFGVHHKLGHKL